ncbi:phosphatase PAP2 family protein [Rhodococcus sp. 27YEA15]|uniref:phosphatase PAP2 family protein n=1 Tax=Rhodococcus sp. 27YEA15 TaxID=3156259 RepID=UPI003C7C4B8D
MAFDQWVLDTVVDQRTPWLVDVVTVVTNSGGTVASWLIASLLTAMLFVRGLRIEAATLAGAMLTGNLVMSGLKLIFTRARPPMPERLIEISSYSFPSGHAMMTAVLATTTAAVVVRLGLPVIARRAMLVLLVLYSVAVGFSRVYLAAHWMTDVLAGWTIGILWAGLWLWGARRLRLRRSGGNVGFPR